MRITPEFPDYRYQDPMRQAELVIYKQIADSDADGVALYECHPTPSSPEIDFVVILEKVAHFAVQVKGGLWRIEDGRFQLYTDEGWVNKTSPAAQAGDAAYAVRNAVRADTGRTIFVIPVILFPDMDPDPDMLSWRGNGALAMLFGQENIIDRLRECAQGLSMEIFHPPTAADIAQELPVLMPGAGPARPAVSGPEPLADPSQAQSVPDVHIHIHLNLG